MVPPIDQVLHKTNVYCRIFGANSMVPVRKDVLCLGFEDGGLSLIFIVMGGHQIEENFLQFNLAKSRIGFNSSLLFHKTSCTNFNFTSHA